MAVDREASASLLHFFLSCNRTQMSLVLVYFVYPSNELVTIHKVTQIADMNSQLVYFSRHQYPLFDNSILDIRCGENIVAFVFVM